jgi:cytoskeletal protein CcmA (bactofilin family)
MSVWNKQHGEGELDRLLRRYTHLPVAVLETRKETKPLSSMSSVPIDGQDSDTGRSGSATIGKAVTIVGQIFSREDLFVDGDVEGTIELMEHKLTVGPNGKVHSGIKAREVVALGAIQGNVEASDRIEIRKDAKLVGDIRASRVVIEDGAYFKGSIDIDKPGPKLAPASPRVPASAASAPTPIAL